MEPIAAHLITGFLGAGKTTTLLHLLRASKARGERAAVLVNEFGALGIDGTLLSSSQALTVREIPDGCICCTLAPRLLEALGEIAQRLVPQRLFIEPTGLARASELKRILGQVGLAEGANRYALGPVLTIVDPVTYRKFSARRMPFYEEQIAEAEIVVANKLDRAPPEDLALFRADLPRLNPRARLIETRFGEVPLDVLTRAGADTGKGEAAKEHLEEDNSTALAGHAHGAGQGEHAGFQRPAEVCFEAARLRAFFANLHAGGFGDRPWRAKGIFRCADGWRLLQLSESGVDETAGVPSPGESRCEIIAAKLERALRERLAAGLAACEVPAARVSRKEA